MPYIQYIQKRFNRKSENLLRLANEILAEYETQGLDLTLRQLYYQFVARDIIKNNLREYKRLQSLVNDARLAGRIDWARIEDRTRNLEKYYSEISPAGALGFLARSYQENPWRVQPVYCEVWVEKDALLGVIDNACQKYRTPFFSCRGYTSQSELWGAAQRFINENKPGVVIHLGDHDPSGVDMSRDIADRLALFEAYNVEIRRIALTMEQIREHNPPPNPAKLTDSRAKGYIRKFGNKSWELDALNPAALRTLIHAETEKVIDFEIWNESLAEETRNREQLAAIHSEFPTIVEFALDESALQQYKNREQ